MTPPHRSTSSTTPEEERAAALRVTHVLRRPVDAHGGVERVVRELLDAMPALRPSWRVSAVSAFPRTGGLEAVPALADVLAGAAVAVEVLRGRHDVVFVHCPECLWVLNLVRPLVRRRALPRVVAVWHGAGPQRFLALRPARNLAARLLARWISLLERGGLSADAHVAVHRLVAEDLRTTHGFDGLVRVVSNAVDGELARALAGTPRATGRDAGEVVVLWVGQTGYAKGLDVALEAYGLARRRHPGLRLLVVGVPGPAPGQAAPDGVEWAGVVPPPGMPAVYLRADVLLFPSRYESFGLVVVEAMAAGLPVVISASIPPDIALDGRNGRVVQRLDARDFADALLDVVSDPRGMRATGERNRADSLRFSSAGMAAGYAQAAEDVAVGAGR
ncbi:hypothetical protein NUM3379_17950 [Kineococcus sp. NUM-3379]